MGSFMRFELWVAAAVVAGAVATFALPSDLLQTASSATYLVAKDSQRAAAELADLNPVTAYTKMMRKVQAGETDAELNFQRSAVTFEPIATPPSSFDFDRGPYSNMRGYGRNSMAWQGSLPH